MERKSTGFSIQATREARLIKIISGKEEGL